MSRKDSRKKIVLFIPDLSMGGTLTLVKTLIRNLRKLYRLFIIVQDNTYNEQMEITPICLNTKHTLLSISRLRSLCQREGIDIVMSFMERANFIAYFTCLGIKSRAILTIHNSPKRAFKHRTRLKSFASHQLYHLIKSSTPIVCVSKGISKELELNYRLTNVSTIYNSIDKSHYIVPKRGDNIAIISHCRLVPQKRIDILIDAVCEIKKAFNKVELSIIGDGPLKKSLLSQIQDKNASTYINIKNNIAIDESLSNSHIYLQSSAFEGFGISMIEAMSHGLAAIAVDCDYGPREILLNKYGVLISDGSRTEIINGISEAVIHLLNNPDQLQKYRELSLERSNDFLSESLMKQYVNIFDSIE